MPMTVQDNLFKVNHYIWIKPIAGLTKYIDEHQELLPNLTD